MSIVRPVGHEERMSLVEHLDELRTRLIVCLLAFTVAFAFCYWRNDDVLNFVNQPLEQTQNLDGTKRSGDPLEQAARYDLAVGAAMRALDPALRSLQQSLDGLSDTSGVPAGTQRQLEESARQLRAAAARVRAAAAAVPTNRERQPVTLGVAEPFVTTFTVAAYAALLLALPVILWQMYAFVLPAFSPNERRVALPLMALVPTLFIAGVAFGYVVALPRAVEFLQNFNDDNFDILIQARDYYRFSILLLVIMGVLFQVPVGVLAVTRLGVISTKQLRANRGYVVLGMAVVAAIATPTPDPVTMVLSMAPLVVLFELSILLARFVERRGPTRSRWDWDDDDEDDEDER